MMSGIWGTRCRGAGDRVTGVIRDSLHVHLGRAGEGRVLGGVVGGGRGGWSVLDTL